MKNNEKGPVNFKYYLENRCSCYFDVYMSGDVKSGLFTLDSETYGYSQY